MKEYMDEKRLLRGAFPKTIQEVKPNPQPITDLNQRRASTQFFAVVSNGQITDQFKVLTRHGRSYAIYYAHLPHVVLEGSILMIILHDLQILIEGRNLDIIEEHFLRGDLLWVKQSPSGKDDGISKVFIREIQVRGSIHKQIGKLKNEE